MIGKRSRLRFCGLARKVLPSQQLADDLAHGHVEAVLIVESHAVIITERLFVNVAKQVESSDSASAAEGRRQASQSRAFPGVGTRGAVLAAFGMPENMPGDGKPGTETGGNREPGNRNRETGEPGNRGQPGNRGNRGNRGHP